MAHSTFDLFKIGISPSISHAMGPILACERFAKPLITDDLLTDTVEVKIDLYASLTLNFQSHATDNASVLGLMSEIPDKTLADDTPQLSAMVKDTGELPLTGECWIYFNLDQHLNLNYHKNILNILTV